MGIEDHHCNDGLGEGNTEGVDSVRKVAKHASIPLSLPTPILRHPACTKAFPDYKASRYSFPLVFQCFTGGDELLIESGKSRGARLTAGCRLDRAFLAK